MAPGSPAARPGPDQGIPENTHSLESDIERIACPTCGWDFPAYGLPIHRAIAHGDRADLSSSGLLDRLPEIPPQELPPLPDAHGSPQLLACEVCEKPFGSVGGLQRHCQSFHGSFTTGAGPRVVLECSECPFMAVAGVVAAVMTRHTIEAHGRPPTRAERTPATASR